MLEPIDTYAFEIRSLKHYELAIAICPELSEIPFEAVHGHFFGLTGELQYATMPLGALAADNTQVVRDVEPLDIVHLIRK